MSNYLKNPNHLMVWPASKDLEESDLLFGNIGVKARYDMTCKELLNACLDAWQKNKETTHYRFFLLRDHQEYEIHADDKQTIKEAGIRHGDPLFIAAG